MNRIEILLFIFIFVTVSCASSNNSSNTLATSEPDFGLKVFSYSMYPDKKIIVLKEHNDLVIANKILSSYNTETLINALSIAYLQLPANQQAYVNHAFQNTTSLPYKFQEALVVAVTTGDEVNQDPILNSLKNLQILVYGNMTQEEVQSRYYYGLTTFEQEVFQKRWNNFVSWYNQQKELYEQQQREQQEQATQSSQAGGFWSTLGKIIIGVVAGYAAYRASTYNSQTDFQLNQLRMQNTQMQWQLNSIQTDLRRLAY